MKIVVAIKQVPARDSQLRVAADGKWIDEDGLDFEINEPDAYARQVGIYVEAVARATGEPARGVLLRV